MLQPGQVVWYVPLKTDQQAKHALAVYVDPTRCLIGDEDGIGELCSLAEVIESNMSL